MNANCPFVCICSMLAYIANDMDPDQTSSQEKSGRGPYYLLDKMSLNMHLNIGNIIGRIRVKPCL